MSETKHISIVGFGRFGKTLFRLLKDDFTITVYDEDTSAVDSLPSNAIRAKTLNEVYENDTIFFAVPISLFDNIIAAHKHHFKPRHTLIDVLSVKVHPATVFKRHVKQGSAQIILTHPMFGPDSSRDGFKDLPIILDKFTANTETFVFWKDFFANKQLRVVEMSAEEHDRLAANSQGLAHFAGRLLEEFNLQETPIDSIGSQYLLELKRQTCNDTWQLFTDLQHYNPYTQKMRLQLGKAYDKVYEKLLPTQINPNHITIGIQGGKGSFNEEAALYWLQRSDITKYELKYLYTTDNVLKALHKGEIDQGQFAIHNSVGGIVTESITAMAAYRFTILDEFAIKISHALMIRPDATLANIKSIMSHPQVFAQCKNTLSQKYPQFTQTPGKGELIDHANVAKHLAQHMLPPSTAVMGSKILADIYDLTLIEDNLQDANENYTSFLMVQR